MIGIAPAMGSSATVTIPKGYPPTVNDAGMAEVVRLVAVEVVGTENVRPFDPKMGGEDFAHFLLTRPGVFFNVECRNEAGGIVWGHHHPQFDIDEESLGVDMETMTTTILNCLAMEPRD